MDCERQSTRSGRPRSAAGQMAGTDPDAKVRRGEILLEVADTQQVLKLNKEAATIYEQVLNEKTLPDRVEELNQRLITALHLAGEYDRCDQVCTNFMREYARSPLMAAVSFRSAENAYFRALAAEKRADFPNKAVELPKLFDEAVKRYKIVLEKFPEFDRVSLARYGLAMSYFHRNEFDEAQKALEAIPLADRVGDLGYAPYLLADCLIRSAPAKADDALAVGMLQEKLQNAQGYLETFIAAYPKAPETPDAMLKLGYCQLRIAILQAMPQERNNGLAAARKTYETLIQTFGKEQQGIQAVLERAKCIAYSGDKNGAINELRRFTQDPLRQNTQVASIAVLQLAVLLREQNKAEEAANLLAEARQRYEPALNNKDNERIRSALSPRRLLTRSPQVAGSTALNWMRLRNWFPVKRWPLRLGCAADNAGSPRVEKPLNWPGETWQHPTRSPTRSTRRIMPSTRVSTLWKRPLKICKTCAEEFKQTLPGAEVRARMFYESAWAWRAVADHEIAGMRSRMQLEKQRLLQAEADRRAPPGTKAPVVQLPDIPLRNNTVAACRE